MTPPGFFRATGLVASKDLRLEWRTWESLSSTVIFSLIVVVVFSFAFDVTESTEDVTLFSTGVLWTVIVFASVVGLTRSMRQERENDAQSALFQAPVDRSALFAGKAVANLIKLSILQAVLVPLTALLFGYDPWPVIGPLALVLLTHGIGLTELGTLFAGVASRVGRGEALLSMLLFPAATPLVLSAVRCTTALLEDGSLTSAGRWMALALGFDALYFFVGLMAYEYVLEE